jgi:hypothetical protein
MKDRHRSLAIYHMADLSIAGVPLGDDSSLFVSPGTTSTLWSFTTMVLSGRKISHMRILTVPLCVTLIIPPFAVSTIESEGVSVPLKSSLDNDMCAVAPLSINQSITDVTKLFVRL